MPAVRMLGRRWSFATDDVPILGFVPTLFHGGWAIALLVTWIIIGKPTSCYEGRGYSVVLGGLFGTFVLFFVLGCWAIYEGLKGDPTSNPLLSAVCPACTGKVNTCAHAPLWWMQRLMVGCPCPAQVPYSRPGSGPGCPTSSTRLRPSSLQRSPSTVHLL